MLKVKHCPKCRKEHSVGAKVCDCGYEFVELVEKEDATVQSSNTKVIVDNTPEFLWSFIGFITLSIYGFILSKVYKESYPVRAKAAKKGAIAFLITLGSCIVIYLAYLILNAYGKIV